MNAADLLAMPDPLAEAAARIKYRRDGIPTIGQALIIRILGRCVDAGDCWEFQGYRDERGYGTLRRDGRMARAHRAVYTELHGELPQDVFVCHTCDNPPCCNPAHLFAGTALDNNRDRQAKGRTRGLKPASERRSFNGEKTHCKRGHEFTPENTRVNPHRPGRRCRTCMSDYAKRRAA